MAHEDATQPSRPASWAACGGYRYLLRRDLGDSGRRAIFIMLNPSIADAKQDDPTIRRCIGFAKGWDCGQLIVLNLFAIRATDPTVMMTANDPEGPDNWQHFERIFGSAGTIDPLSGERDIVVAAWGAHGSHRHQDVTVMGWLDRWLINVECLGQTKAGQPKHPLYLAANSPRLQYQGRA